MQMQTDFDFDGYTYEPQFDSARLTGQLRRVFTLMVDGQWRTLEEIAFVTGGSTASISARLRDFRKQKFGGHVVDRRRLGPTKGIFEYQLIVQSLL